MAIKGNVYGGMTLKALLENPDLHFPPSALSGALYNKGSEKKDVVSSGEIDFTAAFLGPHLWDKTYDDTDFNLEYMDLDQFLSETGIPDVDTPDIEQLLAAQSLPVPPILGATEKLGHPHVPQGPSSSSSLAMLVPAAPAINSHRVTSHRNFTMTPTVEKEPAFQSTETQSIGSTPPVSPLSLHVDFKIREQDVVLSTVPGQDLFDPTSCNFSEEELKPQPIIKKSRKVFVPEDLKDDKYWVRRSKNNNAAKRSRHARRIKENQIALRAAYLEKENETLKKELEKMRQDNVRMKSRLSKYENTCGSSTSVS